MALQGRHGMGKILTEEKMAKIYKDHCAGLPTGLLCEKYGLSKASINKAIREMRDRDAQGQGKG